jgi:regulator of replication initiation timing
MVQEQIDELADKIDRLVAAYQAVKLENEDLRSRLSHAEEQRSMVGGRLDSLLKRLDGIVSS